VLDAAGVRRGPQRRSGLRHRFRDHQGEARPLHRAARTQLKLHLAATWVAVRGNGILGFATVASGSIERHGLPDERLRKRLPDYPLPVLRLARLGVDRRAQGLGLGYGLVRHVLTMALSQRDQVGCVGVVADAKPTALPFYERLGFTPLAGIREGLLHGDPTPMFLHIRTTAAAVDASR
jgi:GNAT superfamily N-acetyltransferase